MTLTLDRELRFVAPDREETPADGEPAVSGQRDHARAVLQCAVDILRRGWLQHGWYRVQPGRHRLRALLANRTPAPDQVRSACLVAAVAVAAHPGGGRVDVMRQAGPALDMVWQALQPGEAPVAGRKGHRHAQVSRMRDLVRWNDAPDRTRCDVLALLDRAIASTGDHGSRS